MARGRKRIVEMSSVDIKAKIESNSAKIEELTGEIKSLRLENKNLTKDLAVAEAKEKEEVAKKELEEIVSMIKNSGKSLDEIKAILEK